MRVLLILFLFVHTDLFPPVAQTFMARLKPGQYEVDATNNDQIIFTLEEGDRFLYDNINHHAYLSDGRFGHVDPAKIIKDENDVIFKFDFSDEAFDLADNNALLVLGRKKKIDFKNLIDLILQFDTKAFNEYVSSGSKVDGAATKIYESLFWKLLNDWDDANLSKMLKAMDANSRKAFIDLMVDVNTTWPIEDHSAYYEKYYPRTFERYLQGY